MRFFRLLTFQINIKKLNLKKNSILIFLEEDMLPPSGFTTKVESKSHSLTQVSLANLTSCHYSISHCMPHSYYPRVIENTPYLCLLHMLFNFLKLLFSSFLYYLSSFYFYTLHFVHT